jgi:hypothetical protein
MMSIHHIAEQLEAARRDNSQTTAVRIIHRYLKAAKRPTPLNALKRLMLAYWHDPVAGLTLIHSWH